MIAGAMLWLVFFGTFQEPEDNASLWLICVTGMMIVVIG